MSAGSNNSNAIRIFSVGLPLALTPEQDQLIQDELKRRDDLASNFFLLQRHTGMRLGECLDLSIDCIRPVAPDQSAILVPLGKLKTERLVPVDSFVCGVCALYGLRMLPTTSW